MPKYLNIFVFIAVGYDRAVTITVCASFDAAVYIKASCTNVFGDPSTVSRRCYSIHASCVGVALCI